MRGRKAAGHPKSPRALQSQPEALPKPNQASEVWFDSPGGTDQSCDISSSAATVTPLDRPARSRPANRWGGLYTSAH